MESGHIRDETSVPGQKRPSGFLGNISLPFFFRRDDEARGLLYWVSPFRVTIRIYTIVYIVSIFYIPNL